MMFSLMIAFLFIWIYEKWKKWLLVDANIDLFIQNFGIFSNSHPSKYQAEQFFKLTLLKACYHFILTESYI